METAPLPQPEQPRLFENPEQQGFEYELLQGHERTDGSYKTSEQLRTEYVRLTDDIIHRAVNGIEVKNPATGEIERRPIDYIVWLDKSARPVSWLFTELWTTLAADKDGNVPSMPESKFVNIDRNQWASDIDPQGVGRVEVQSIDQSVIRSLRSVFLKNPTDRAAGLIETIDTAPTLFDGKTVLIVDEVRSSGRTLEYAEAFFRRAFPDAAAIDGTHWMAGMTTIEGAVGNADIPVWYSDMSDLGRGIGNRNVDRSRLSPSTAQRLGAWFLSTPLGIQDPMSKQLRNEFKQLAKDVRNGTMLVEPSRDRDDADYDERALRFNKLDNFSEYLIRLQAQRES